MFKKPMIVSFGLFFLVSFCICFAQAEEYEGETIKEVSVLGNKLVSESITLSKIKTKKGDKFEKETVNEDLKRLYDSGYFSNISVDVEPVTGGVKVSFIVKEKPMFKEVIFIGNKKFKSSKLQKLMKSNIGEVLNESQIKEDIEAIREFYEKKGFTLAKIDHEINVDEATGRAIVTVNIEEGLRLDIADVKFTGNTVFKPKEILKVMKTRKDSLFSSGVLKEEEFQADLENIVQLYRSKGYIDVKIADVKREYNTEKTKIWITIDIAEGKQYFIGVIAIEGNEKFGLPELQKELKSKPEDVFSPPALNKDLARIRDFYYSRGYIDARVRANTSLDEKTGKMDIVFNIVEGEITYVNRVEVRGNSRTKDIVIRREVAVIPGQICDSIKIKKSQERLQNLGYFKYVDVSLRPTDEKRKKDVVIEVEEQKTGEISFGAGYSSIDYLIGFIEISQKNFDLLNFPSFIGGGQKLRFRTEIGSKRQDYVLSFTEPWFMGRRLSAGFDVFKRTRKYYSKYFEEKRLGGDIRFGKELGEYNRGDLIYTYQKIDITNVRDDASWEIKQEAGTRYVGSVGLGLTRDTRDSWILPTKGYRLNLTPEVAGIGGDTDFTKVTGSASIYFPLFWEHILRLGTQAGVVEQYGSSERVPIFDRFFLGGANTVRGFKYRAISPRDENDEPIGGKTMGMATAEYTFPLITRVRGACFFDIGGVFPEAGQFDLDKLNGAVGVGVRLNLPIGPIQVDYGWPVITDENNEGADGKLSFTMGSTF
jgi:outer membrane protein insertion porin family